MADNVNPERATKDEPTGVSGRFPVRRAALIAGIALLALSLGAAAGWIFRTTVTEWIIAAYLTNEDVSEVSLTVEAVETDHILIKNLRMNGKTPITVARIRLDYRIDDFLDGRIEKLAVFDVRSINGEVPIEIDRIEGDGTFTGGFHGLTTLVAGLDVIKLRVGAQQFEPGRVDIHYKDEVLSLDASFGGAFGHATLIAKGKLDAGPDPFNWFVSGRVDAAAISAALDKRIDAGGKIAFSIFGDIDDPLFFTRDDRPDDTAFPGVLSVEGEIGATLDRLVIDGQHWPAKGHQRLKFSLSNVTSANAQTTAAFSASLDIDKRKLPEFGFESATLQVAGTLDLSESRLAIHLADGPLLRIQTPRLSKAPAIKGDLALNLSGNVNQVDIDLSDGTAWHRVDGRLSWPDSDIAVHSAGHFSDPDDPVIVTLRGAFDATPFLALRPETAGARGKANIFVAGRVTQPFPPRTGPSQDQEPWPGDVRLDAAFGLKTTGIRLPGSTNKKPAEDSIEISLKGFNGTSGHQQGRLAVTAALDGRNTGTVRLGQARLNLQGRIVHGARGYQIFPTFDSALSLQEIRTTNGIALPSGLTIQLAGDENEITLSDTMDGIRHKLTFAHLEADGFFETGDKERQPFRLTIPKLGSRSTDLDGYMTYAAGATIDLPKAQLTIRNVNASAEGRDKDLKFRFEAAEVRHTASPPLTTPLSVSAKGQVKDDRVSAKINAKQSFGPIRLRSTVTHDLATRAGRVDFSVPPFRLGPSPNSLAEAFPPAAKWLKDAEGGASLTGHLLWDGDVLSGQMSVGLDHLSVTSEEARLADLTGTVNFIELVPLAMPPRQRVTGNVTVGEIGPLPARVEFQLREDGTLAIQDLDLEVAGGNMRTRGTVRSGDTVTADADLNIQSIDLAELFRIIGVDGLAGTGRISGTVPIKVRGEDVTIQDGLLKAEGTGTLRYSGTALQKQLSGRADTVGTVMQVLSDFRYDKLSIDLNKSADGTGSILLRMKGNNPAVYDGHPFAFNINIESDFHKLGRIALGGIQALVDAIGKTDRSESRK